MLKRRTPVSTSRRNKNDLFFYHAIKREEPDIGTVEHAGVQGGGDNKRDEEFDETEAKPLQRQDGQDVEVQSQQNEGTLRSRVCAKWKTMPTWKKTAAVATSTSLISAGIGIAAYLIGGTNSNLSWASASHGNESTINFPFPINQCTASIGVPSDVYPMNPIVQPGENATLTVDQNGSSSTVKNNTTTDVNHPNPDNGRTPLMEAADNGRLEDIKEVIKSGANVNLSDHSGRTALMYAVIHGDLEVVEELIKSGAKVDQSNHLGTTPLMYAAKYGRLEVVEELIKAGANVNESNGLDETPLRLAIKNGCLEAVIPLIKSGAKVDHSDKGGRTALMATARFGDLEAAKALIKSGAKVDHSDKGGRTALMYAARFGRLEVVEELIKSGANVTHSDKDGATTLKLAESYGYSDIGELLRKSGAKVEMGVVST